MAEDTGNAKTVALTAKSNCDVVANGGKKLVFRFPDQQGFLTPAKWEFRDRTELVEFVAQMLSVEPEGEGLRGSAICCGKYERRCQDGSPAFTFGDPVLDLITDPAGEIVIGGHRTNLAALELESPRYRSGGIRSIELSVLSETIRNQQLAMAAMGQGDMTIVECNAEVVALASTNPSQRDFWLNGRHLRFKAWKKRRVGFYWSIGAEIETWGHDFTTARIDSRYYVEAFGQTCTIGKVDADTDSNDDYLDEYEWGINSPQPIRVVADCRATWQGREFVGQVTAGPECFVV